MTRHPVIVSVWTVALLLTLALGVGSIPTRAADPHGPPNSSDTSGRGDLAISVPFEHIGGILDAGAVNLLRGGSADGLSATGNQVWYQDSTGSVTASETNDMYGYALAMGDFNRDGYIDLAVGMPFEDLDGPIVDAGGVQVWYGSSSGISAAGNQFWSEESTDIADTAEAGDQFGYKLAVGDYNGDRYDDLAIGVNHERIGVTADAGAVHVLYGSATGLSASGSQFWNQNTPGVQGTAETDDWFGRALAAGDFNGDGYDDLAVGVPYEHFAVTDDGVVHILFGSATGLTATGNQLWSQDSADIADTAETDDRFGLVLTAGDFNGDGYDDLAIGVPFENVGAVSDAGAVNVLYGSATGLSATGNQLWYQGLSGVQGTPEAGDNFGLSLIAGDFNGDGSEDLAIGVPFEHFAVANDGVVHVLFGSAAGLTAAGNQLWSQDSGGILDACEDSDLFGASLATGDLNHDGYDDLATGVPYEDIGAIIDAGAVNILYGSAGGLSATGNQFWNQDSPDIQGGAEAGDFFGWALAAVRTQQFKLHLPLITR